MDHEAQLKTQPAGRELSLEMALAIASVLPEALRHAELMMLPTLVIDPKWWALAIVDRYLVITALWTMRLDAAGRVPRIGQLRMAAMAAGRDGEGWIGAAVQLASISAEARLGPPARA